MRRLADYLLLATAVMAVLFVALWLTGGRW